MTTTRPPRTDRWRHGPSGASPTTAERRARGLPRMVGVSLGPDDVARLDALCAARGEGRSAVVRAALAALAAGETTTPPPGVAGASSAP